MISDKDHGPTGSSGLFTDAWHQMFDSNPVEFPKSQTTMHSTTAPQDEDEDCPFDYEAHDSGMEDPMDEEQAAITEFGNWAMEAQSIDNGSTHSEPAGLSTSYSKLIPQ